MTKKLMMVVATLAAAFGALADTWTDPDTGYTWTYRINGDTAEIYENGYSPAISPKPTGTVTIPSTLGGKPVTSIGPSAFYNCSGLTSVTIPDSVTSIGEGAFSYCSGLTSVHISDLAKWCGISFYRRSANPLYYAHNLYLNGEKVADLVIPDGVTSIANYAFADCSGLTSVTIPDGVTSIGEGAFSGCSGLRSFIVGSGNANYKSVNGLLLTKDGKTLVLGVNGDVVISDGVTSIGDYAFYNCSGLTSVTIGNGVTSIGSSAFYDCIGLTSVTIPDGVTSIGSEAFRDCSGLTSVTIPDSVTSIGSYAFDGCCGLIGVRLPDFVSIDGDYDGLFDWDYLLSIDVPQQIGKSLNDWRRYEGYYTSISVRDVVCVVRFDGNGGFAGMSSLEWHNPNTQPVVGMLPGAFRPGYVFDGWYTAADGGEKVTAQTTVRAGEITFYAHWTAYGSGTGGDSAAIVQGVAAPYALTDVAADRAIAEVTVDTDYAIDSFVLKDGEVYDSVLYVSNTADNTVKLTLPSGFVYKTYKGTKPLEIPAKSQCMLSITRVADKTFLVSREELEDVQ